MTTLIASAEAIILLLGIGAVGFFMVARGMVKADVLPVLSTLAIEVSLPLYVFAVLMQQFDPAADSNWWLYPLWWAGFALATLGLSLLAGYAFPASVRREARTALYLHNAIFVPLAVIIGLFGTASHRVPQLFLFTLFSVAFYFNFYPFLYRQPGEKGSTKRPPDWRKLFNPLIRMTLFTLLLILSGAAAYVPQVLVDVAGRVGDLAFSLVMLTLGGYIYLDMKAAGVICWSQIIRFILIKNLLFPLLALAFVALVRPGEDIAFLLVLSAAAPPLSTVPILAQRQGGDVAASNQFLVGSFLAAILTIPLAILVLDRILYLY